PAWLTGQAVCRLDKRNETPRPQARSKGVERHQFPDMPDAFWKSWEPAKDAMDLNRRRIAERTKMAALPLPRQFLRPTPRWPGRASGWRAARSLRHHC